MQSSIHASWSPLMTMQNKILLEVENFTFLADHNIDGKIRMRKEMHIIWHPKYNINMQLMEGLFKGPGPTSDSILHILIIIAMQVCIRNAPTPPKQVSPGHV
jgi:hypothetical protein